VAIGAIRIVKKAGIVNGKGKEQVAGMSFGGARVVGKILEVRCYWRIMNPEGGLPQRPGIAGVAQEAESSEMLISW
jgi:hypothetical protein